MIVMSKVRYVYQLSESSIYSSEEANILIKDDEETVDKIKGLVKDIIRNDISDCEDRVGIFSGVESKELEHSLDWLESLKNKLDEVDGYQFAAQFKSIELLNSDIYVTKLEVI